MAYKIHNVNGLKVYTGDLSITPKQLDSLKRETSVIVDAYFCKRTADGVEERVLYNQKMIRDKKAGLGLRIESPNGEQSTLHIGGLGNIMSALSELEVTLESLAHAVGRQVNAYRNSIALYGIWVPKFAKERITA